MPDEDSQHFFILSLDGGGAKGMYTLGVLKEVERLLRRPIHEHFRLIYGTSTGSIIGSLLALGESVESIAAKYFEMVPQIMRHCTRSGRSRALIHNVQKVFADRTFDAFLTNVGIVATHYDYRKPMIFKTSVDQAYGRTSTFRPGFGCKIADAVVASCSAFPFFERCEIVTENQGSPELLDGGFVANNPTLFALSDALKGFHIPRERIRILSIGVGHYPEPRSNWLKDQVIRWWPFQLIEMTFSINTNTVEQIRLLLFPDITVVRIDDAFTDEQYSTNFLESDLKKLEKMKQLGRESFAIKEQTIRSMLL